MPMLSIVCPAFDEEDVLPLFHERLCFVLSRLTPPMETEIVYVDDGSRDGTLAVLKRLAVTDGRVRYLSFSRNFGHQAALTAGLEYARGDAVITLDSDLQHPPELIPRLLEPWRDGCDVVQTVREDDPDLSVFKRWTSRLFYRLLRRCGDVEVRDAAADYRLLSRKAVDALLRLRERHRFLRGLVQWLGFPTAEVRFSPGRRQAGVSKYTLRRMLALAGDGLVSFSRLPLRLTLLAGLLMLGCGIAYGCYAAARALLAAPGFDAATACLVLLTLTCNGATLCAVGVVGEYVGRIHDQVKERPLYLIQETSDEVAAPRERIAA